MIGTQICILTYNCVSPLSMLEHYCEFQKGYNEGRVVHTEYVQDFLVIILEARKKTTIYINIYSAIGIISNLEMT